MAQVQQAPVSQALGSSGSFSQNTSTEASLASAAFLIGVKWTTYKQENSSQNNSNPGFHSNYQQGSIYNSLVSNTSRHYVLISTVSWDDGAG